MSGTRVVDKTNPLNLGDFGIPRDVFFIIISYLYHGDILAAATHPDDGIKSIFRLMSTNSVIRANVLHYLCRQDTFLRYAIWLDNASFVDQCLAINPKDKINQPCNTGITPFGFAMQQGSAKALERLLQNEHFDRGVLTDAYHTPHSTSAYRAELVEGKLPIFVVSMCKKNRAGLVNVLAQQQKFRALINDEDSTRRTAIDHAFLSCYPAGDVEVDGDVVQAIVNIPGASLFGNQRIRDNECKHTLDENCTIMRGYYYHHIYSSKHRKSFAYTVMLSAFRTVSDDDNLYNMGHMLIEHLRQITEELICHKKRDKYDDNCFIVRAMLFGKTVLAILANPHFTRRWREVKQYLEQKKSHALYYCPKKKDIRGIQRILVNIMLGTKNLTLKKEFIEMALCAEGTPLYEFLRMKPPFRGKSEFLRQLQDAFGKLYRTSSDEPPAPASDAGNRRR